MTQACVINLFEDHNDGPLASCPAVAHVSPLVGRKEPVLDRRLRVTS